MTKLKEVAEETAARISGQWMLLSRRAVQGACVGELYRSVYRNASKWTVESGVYSTCVVRFLLLNTIL